MPMNVLSCFVLRGGCRDEKGDFVCELFFMMWVGGGDIILLPYQKEQS
jgi:hypothetical protein